MAATRASDTFFPISRFSARSALVISLLDAKLQKLTGTAAVAPARFYSFTDLKENTREQIQKVKSHPWIPKDIPVRGFVYDVNTGRMQEVTA